MQECLSGIKMLCLTNSHGAAGGRKMMTTSVLAKLRDRDTVCLQLSTMMHIRHVDSSQQHVCSLNGDLMLQSTLMQVVTVTQLATIVLVYACQW